MSDNNVLPFPTKPRDELGWVCGCGETLWTLYENVDCVCNGCYCISTMIKVVRAALSAHPRDHRLPGLSVAAAAADAG